MTQDRTPEGAFAYSYAMEEDEAHSSIRQKIMNWTKSVDCNDTSIVLETLRVLATELEKALPRLLKDRSGVVPTITVEKPLLFSITALIGEELREIIQVARDLSGMPPIALPTAKDVHFEIKNGNSYYALLKLPETPPVVDGVTTETLWIVHNNTSGETITPVPMMLFTAYFGSRVRRREELNLSAKSNMQLLGLDY